MNHRERFFSVMKGRPVDRVPHDLAGTSLTGVEHGKTVEALRRELGIVGDAPGPYRKFDERILERLGVDFRRVGDILSPESPVARPASGGRYTDCWGVTRAFTGLYWDIVEPPLKGAAIEDLERYPWPKAGNIDPRQIAAYRAEARRLREETDAVVCGEHPVYGILELGCWMCGFDDFLFRMAMEPAFVRRFFEIVLRYQKDVVALYYGAVGEYLHVTTSGDDFGTQTGPMVSPRMFEELVQPFFAERIRYTREFTDAFYFHHTCGSVFALIPNLIAAGVDILNPIQPGARDMEPARLKEAYGNRLVFWGGVDTQRLLPHGSPGEVRAAARRVVGEMGGTGYVLAPAHNIQPDVPARNILAMFGL